MIDNQPSYRAWRFYLVLIFIILIGVGLMGRVYDLAILDQHFLQHQSDERVVRLVSTPSLRGMILDRNGFPLAVSTAVFSIWLHPKEFISSNKTLSKLAYLLEIKTKDIIRLKQKAEQKKRTFVYLKRSVAPEIASHVKALGIPGIYLQQEYRRYYPEGEVMSHVIGLTNVDDRGQEGLELAYDQYLQGESGKKWVIKDRLGRIISDVQMVNDQKAGNDLVLSIDRRIQYLAYRELLAGVSENKARSASAVVLDVKTGEVLAMVNVPSYNPNDRQASRGERIRNRALTDTFEPGSTIKAFTVTSALESGLFKPTTIIDTAPGWMRVGHNVVKDEHNNGLLSIEQILQHSSNVGVSKLVLALPPDQLWSVLHRVGFGEGTGIAFPGEQQGVLIHRQPWSAFMLATLSFGYGLSTTTLQLARAYLVLANNGVKLPISLLKLNKSPQGERVLNDKITKQMLVLLESVFNKGGTAQSASVEGYRIAGKTGTAKKVGSSGYEKHKYTSSLVGTAPVTHPRLVVAVVMHDPQGKKYFGGDVSGPVFQKIMEGSLRLLSVSPDAERRVS